MKLAIYTWELNSSIISNIFFCITIPQFSYWRISDIIHADSDPSVMIIISPEQNIDQALLQNTNTVVGCSFLDVS